MDPRVTKTLPEYEGVRFLKGRKESGKKGKPTRPVSHVRERRKGLIWDPGNNPREV